MGAMSGVTPTFAVRSGRSVRDSYQLPSPVEPLRVALLYLETRPRLVSGILKLFAM